MLAKGSFMQTISPFLWFNDEAEEAANFYVSLFKNSKIGKIRRYSKAGPREEGSVMTVEFRLDGQDFIALNGGQTGFAATGPAPGSIALFVTCETQADVDRLWDAFCDGGETMQCGWVKDKYGVVWNIVPAGLVDYVSGDDPVRAERATRAMFLQNKLDINEIRRAYEEEAV